MHCGDQDTRISSILPPFNVLHAQVVQRGRTGLPRVLGEGEATLSYSAASNPNDPAIAKVASGQALSSVVNGDVYKTNFWEVAFQAYDPFYPPGILAAFYDPNNPANNVDIGLPVPDVERLYLGDGQLHATQQAMPGLNNPYILNEAQTFQEHFTDFPFFINFPFGYVANNVNWFEAAGVPIAMFDDFGRENPYPLVRVQAKQGAAHHRLTRYGDAHLRRGRVPVLSCGHGRWRQRRGHQEPHHHQVLDRRSVGRHGAQRGQRRVGQRPQHPAPA